MKLTMPQKTELEGFPLPKVAEVLAPYIKTRQEVLQIRQILTIFIAQSIEGSPIKSLSSRSLAVPSDDTLVKHVPLELTGVRKRYMHALQAHAKAREAYELQVRGPDEVALKAMRQEQRKIENDTYVSIVTRLELLHEQRKYQKLRILQDYVDLLAKKDAAKSDHSSTESILRAAPPAPELHSGVLIESQSKNSTRALILCLHKAVLCAKNNLEMERNLLARLKGEDNGAKISKETVSDISSTELLALSRTRDRLIEWIEQQLAKGTQGEEVEDKIQSEHHDKVPVDVAQRQKKIEEKYEDYLQARRSLVAFMSELNGVAIGAPVAKQKNPSPQENAEVDMMYQEAALVLPYLTEHLIPAADAHKSFLQQESHFSHILKNETRETAKALDRLASESHLLPDFPLLATQPRFQNIVASLRSENLPRASNEKPESEELQTIDQVRKWASAASAASTARRAAVEERLDYGEKHLGIAQGLVRELQKILGEDHEVDETEVDPQSHSQKTKDKSQKVIFTDRTSRDQMGLWAGLDGNISIEDQSSRNIP